MRKIFYALNIFVLCMGIARAEFELSFSENGTDTIKAELGAVIPTKMKEVLGRKIFISFEKLDESVEFLDPCDDRSGKQIFGKAQNGKIILSRNFLTYLNTEGESFSCGHKNFHRLLLATIVHELSHLLDDGLKGISQKPLYQALAHAAKNKIKNRKTLRVPDPYELTNTAEHFAVNMEYFILDSEYPCRRPNLNHFFSATLGTGEKSCEFYERVNGNLLSPEEVIEVHYLIADKGEAMMSRFGHSMYRLKMKNGNDLVVGFSGEMNDAVIDSMKGLTGKYASRLLISSLAKVRGDYNKNEWRGLKSYPITLNESQKKAFVQEIVTLYWEYSGRYYFLSNNCADEALSLLKVGLPTEKILKASVLTPLDITALLKSSGQISESTMEYFPSYRDQMKKIYESVGNKNTVSFENYIKLRAEERRQTWKPGLSRREMLGLMSLEITLQNMESKKFEGFVLGKVNELKDGSPLKTKLRASVGLSNALTFGLEEAQGYGIPLESDVIQQGAQSERVEQELSQDMNEFFDWAKDLSSPSKIQIVESETNIGLIRDMIKTLK